jgi:hypothetical protein
LPALKLGIINPLGENQMKSSDYRFEQTDYGFRLYVKRGNAFVHFGHFTTKADAKRIYADYLNHQA